MAGIAKADDGAMVRIARLAATHRARDLEWVVTAKAPRLKLSDAALALHRHLVKA